MAASYDLALPCSGGGGGGGLCASQCQCSTGVERRATSVGGKMVGVGAIKRWLTSLWEVGRGGFALLQIKLQALLGLQLRSCFEGRMERVCASTAAYTMTFLGGGVAGKWALMRLCGTCILNV